MVAKPLQKVAKRLQMQGVCMEACQVRVLKMGGREAGWV